MEISHAKKISFTTHKQIRTRKKRKMIEIGWMINYTYGSFFGCQAVSCRLLCVKKLTFHEKRKDLVP